MDNYVSGLLSPPIFSTLTMSAATISTVKYRKPFRRHQNMLQSPMFQETSLLCQSHINKRNVRHLYRMYG
jgi:hypothetical protein